MAISNQKVITLDAQNKKNAGSGQSSQQVIAAPTVVTPKALEVLRDVYSFSKIKRYHGLLPETESAVYDEGTIQNLVLAGLLEEGIIFTTCGSKLRGWRLTGQSQKLLEETGVDFNRINWENIRQTPSIDEDGLEKEHFDVLLDIYHMTKVKVFSYVAPKDLLEPFGRNMLKFLYDAGYLLYIKIKGSDVKRQKGYILTDRATGILKKAGLIN